MMYLSIYLIIGIIITVLSEVICRKDGESLYVYVNDLFVTIDVEPTYFNIAIALIVLVLIAPIYAVYYTIKELIELKK